MALEGDVTITGVARAEKDPQLADSEDVSAGVAGTFEQPVNKVVLFLDVGAAVDLSVELTPDTGQEWYSPQDSALPISFGSAGQDVVVLNYPCTGIRITGSNNTSVSAEVLAVA